MVTEVKEELEIAKKIIKEETKKAGLNLIKIILFGSRAKGNYSKDSDWDFLIVVKEELDREKKHKLTSNIRLSLVYSNIPSDVILISEKRLKEIQNDKGYLVYYALKQGIPV